MLRITGRKAIAACLTAVMLFSGCSKNKPENTSPMKNDPAAKTEIELDLVENKKFDEKKMNAEYGRYCFSLMSQIADGTEKNCNVMISPASIMMALDMCAAGAKSATLRQLTDLFARDADPLEQQAFASALMKRINAAQKVDFACANAVWNNKSAIGDSINAEYKEYIQKTFGAEFRTQKFDNKTHKEINKWIDEKTNHMIKDAVPQLDPTTVMVLVNAIRFEGKWKNGYTDNQIVENDFNGTKGSKKTKMLSSQEEGFFMTEKATGFIKQYQGDEYAFVAILPKDKNANANEFIKSFTYDDYREFIDSRKYMGVYAVMPEFKSDFGVNINEPLKNLGVTQAFDPNNADLTGIASSMNENLYISKVFHKTHIEVDRNGTKAAAVTTVEIDANSSSGADFEEVICNRPYVYAIVERSTMNPIFIGTVNNVD